MRRSLSLLALAALTALAVGSAAALVVDGGTIQAGVDESLACDTNGVTIGGWGLETLDDSVRSVRINGIDPACAGNDLFVKVTDAGGGFLADGGPQPIDDVTESVALGPFPSPDAIANVHVYIEGGTVTP